MYIAPSSTIAVYRDIPLDPTYDHTLFFAGREAQTTYFSSRVAYLFTSQMYTRCGRKKLRIECPADNLYNCNYLSFVNKKSDGSGTNGKSFYCFITSVEYINNRVTEIEFEIDVMQTWLCKSKDDLYLVGSWDYELEMCFVEREHSTTDNIGDNLVPESLDTGDYVHDNVDGTGYLGAKKIIVAATFDTTYTDTSGSYYGGLYSGLTYNVFDGSVSGAQAAANFIANAGAKSQGIVSIFYAPANFVTNMLQPAASYAFTKPKKNTSSDIFGGYYPKNKKLYTYPYNFLYVTNFQGSNKVYQYEYFSGANCDFRISGDFTSNPMVILAPEHYKGESTTNYNEMLTISGWPQCAYNTDIYKAWLAQTAASLPFTALQTAGQGIASVYAANTMAAALGTAGAMASAEITIPVLAITAAVKVAGILAQGAEKRAMGNQPHGMQSGTTLAACGLLDFGFYHMRIRREFAEIIDNYFSMYGYATHRVKIPNIHVRTEWTYTKTVGCKLKGAIPAEAASKICEIFDRGITFWANGDHMGDYSLSNNIRSGLS